MALESSTGISPFPFLWVNRTMRVYHYSDIRVMAATFPTVAYGSLAWSLASLSLLFMGHGVPVRRLTAYQTYLITLFSFQRTVKSGNEVVGTLYYTYFTLTSNPKIASISAARILPFSSISTTIYIFPCSS